MNGWEIFGVVLSVALLPTIFGLLTARNWEFERVFGKLYFRVKISNTAFYVWSRDKLKRTNWLELGHIENLSGTHRLFTITIFLTTAQIGWTGQLKQKEYKHTESVFTYKNNVYTGAVVPEDIKRAWEDMNKTRDEMLMTADEILKRFKGKQ